MPVSRDYESRRSGNFPVGAPLRCVRELGRCPANHAHAPRPVSPDPRRAQLHWRVAHSYELSTTSAIHSPDAGKMNLLDQDDTDRRQPLSDNRFLS